MARTNAVKAANAFADWNAKGNLSQIAHVTLANVAWNATTEAHRTNLAPRARIATIHTAVRIAMFAIKIVKTVVRRYKIAPRVTAPILGQGITAKRAALTAKTEAHQTKIAPLARIATIHGAVRIAQHVRCNKAVAPAERL